MMDEERSPERAEPRKKMSRAEAGRKGGKRTRERYGSEFFREIGRIGGSKSTAMPKRGSNGAHDTSGSPAAAPSER